MYVYTITQSSLWISYTNIWQCAWYGVNANHLNDGLLKNARSVHWQLGTSRYWKMWISQESTTKYLHVFWYQKLKMENSLVIMCIYIYIHIVILAFFQLWETSLIKRRSAIVFFLLLLRPFGLQWTCNCGTSVFRWPDVLWGASLSDGKGNDFIWHEKQASTTNKKTYIWKKSHSSMNIFWVIHLL